MFEVRTKEDKEKEQYNGSANMAVLFGVIALVFSLFPIIGVPFSIASFVNVPKGLKSEKTGRSYLALFIAVVALIISVVSATIGAINGYNRGLEYQRQANQESVSQPSEAQATSNTQLDQCLQNNDEQYAKVVEQTKGQHLTSDDVKIVLQLRQSQRDECFKRYNK